MAGSKPTTNNNSISKSVALPFESVAKTISRYMRPQQASDSWRPGNSNWWGVPSRSPFYLSIRKRRDPTVDQDILERAREEGLSIWGRRCHFLEWTSSSPMRIKEITIWLVWYLRRCRSGTGTWRVRWDPKMGRQRKKIKRRSKWVRGIRNERG